MQGTIFHEGRCSVAKNTKKTKKVVSSPAASSDSVNPSPGSTSSSATSRIVPDSVSTDEAKKRKTSPIWKKFLSGSSTTASAQSSQPQTAELTEAPIVRGPNDKKGRPTPKRRDAQPKKEVYRGTPPMTKAEARQRKKALAPQTKEEKRAATQARRQAAREHQARYLAGEEDYLPAKDKGPVRRFARNAIDKKLSISNYFIPIAFVCYFLMLVTHNNREASLYITLTTITVVVILLLDAIIQAFIVVRQAKKQFPREKFGSGSLGVYAFSRCISLPRLRKPVSPYVKRK